MSTNLNSSFHPGEGCNIRVADVWAVGSFLFYCPKLDVIFAGTVGQLTAAAPFRIVLRLVRIMEGYLENY